MIVLATAAALTSGLTADAFARGTGGGFGGSAHMGGGGGGRVHMGGGFEGRSVAVGGHHGGTWRGFAPVYGLGFSYGYPITIPAARLRTDVRQHRVLLSTIFIP
jgi:hypothetical protein